MLFGLAIGLAIPARSADPTATGLDATAAGCLFDNYHPGDPRDEKNKGQDRSEGVWRQVAKLRFAAHPQPKEPLWGYADESEPKAMGTKIATNCSPGSNKPLVGAIRWDAWQENGDIQATVERTLGPNHWHYRLPFFARVTGSNSVAINGNTQTIMDQEINYAANAGIDYWAFVIYPAASGMSHGLQLYLKSRFKNRIHFTLNLQGGWVAGKTEGWDAQMTRYVNYFKDPAYQKVLGNRPLVFLFNRIARTPEFPDAVAGATAIQQLRAATTNAGLGNPYIVFQGWNATDDFNTMREYGLDAIGAYAVFSDPAIGTSYPALAAKARRMWEAGQATGANVVPIVTAGWDDRTRVENRTPWTTGSTNYTVPPTPAELANHLADALQWTSSHLTTATPARTVLIYAWNENDEGGWLVPTLNPDGSTNADRLAAIAAKLKHETESNRLPRARISTTQSNEKP